MDNPTIKEASQKESYAAEVAKKLRTFYDWLNKIDAIQIIVTVTIAAVEQIFQAKKISGVIMTGPEKLEMAVDILRTRIGATGWFSLFVGIALKLVVSFAVSSMNQRYGKEWWAEY